MRWHDVIVYRPTAKRDAVACVRAHRRRLTGRRSQTQPPSDRSGPGLGVWEYGLVCLRCFFFFPKTCFSTSPEQCSSRPLHKHTVVCATTHDCVCVTLCFCVCMCMLSEQRAPLISSRTPSHEVPERCSSAPVFQVGAPTIRPS